MHILTIKTLFLFYNVNQVIKQNFSYDLIHGNEKACNMQAIR